MQAQLDSLQEQADAANQVHGVIQHLVDGGLIKELAPGQYEGVGSYQEQQQLLAQRQSDSQAFQQEGQRQQLNQQQVWEMPSQDRIRPSMQLELQEEKQLNVQQFMEEEDPEDRDKDIGDDNF